MLKELSKENKPASDLIKVTSMYKSHLSRTLKELKEEKLIECLNPNDREFKFYKLTKKSKEILKDIK